MSKFWSDLTELLWTGLNQSTSTDLSKIWSESGIDLISINRLLFQQHQHGSLVMWIFRAGSTSFSSEKLGMACLVRRHLIKLGVVRFWWSPWDILPDYQFGFEPRRETFWNCLAEAHLGPFGLIIAANLCAEKTVLCKHNLGCGQQLSPLFGSKYQ